MASIQIQNVQPAVLEALKRLAKSHNRSLQDELVAILEDAASTAPSPDPGSPEWITVRTKKCDVSHSRRDMYDDNGR